MSLNDQEHLLNQLDGFPLLPCTVAQARNKARQDKAEQARKDQNKAFKEEDGVLKDAPGGPRARNNREAPQRGIIPLQP